MADNKENYYKTAGLQEGNEIVRFNDVPYGSVSKGMVGEFRKRESFIMDIVRSGKSMKIALKIDHSEKQGD